MHSWTRNDFAQWFAIAGRALLSPDPGKLSALEDAGAVVQNAINQLEDAIAADSASIDSEYVRLFLDPRGAPCPPWQSARTEEQQLFGSSHESALWWYRAEGVEPALAGEPADHAGLLLLFGANLLAGDAPQEWADRFFTAHIAWIGEFCEQVYHATHHPYFRVLAGVTAESIAEWSAKTARTIQ
jgi:TorA maturation chaperone TorD